MPQLQHITSGPLPYLLSMPLKNENANKIPILCFLHGKDEAQPMKILKALTLHGPLRPENLDRLKDNFIIIAPQTPKAGDLWYKFSKHVHEIVQNVQNQCNGDVKRTYLTGFSFGGNGVFDIADSNPNFFAAI
uniref:Phospholipase/carboxylesterase/thioesterase domain-containing protein n=1 Tax=Panagrolaimus davidi TaxID=227884 RepID=A0A914RAS8_9BILA